MTTQNTAPLFKSGTGIALIDFDSSHDESVCSIIQSDQKIIVVGSTIKKFNDYTHYTWNFALTRLTKEGLIDSSFGNFGKTITDINSSHDFGNSALVDNYGNIFVAGSSSEGSAIVSYKSNGQLNESFNQNGKINNIAANAGKIAIQSDGMLLIAGSMTNNVKLFRYKSDGSLDLNFGVNGATSSFYDTSDQYLRKNVNGLLIQSDGKIVVESFGDSGYDGGSTSFNLTRFKSNGDLDSTFGVNGMVTTMIPTYNSPLGLTIQADGKLLVTGRALVNSVYQLVLLRYNSNGTLDDSFGINGKVMTSTASSGGAVCIQSDGKILVAGGIDTDFELIRFNINGTIDDSFGQNGLTKTDLGNFETVKDITILPTGKILVTGYSRDYSGLYSDFAIVRYNENGTLDKTFSPKTPFSTTLELLENNGFIKLDGNLGIYDSELANINDYAGSSVSLLRKGGANAEDIFSGTNNLSTLTEGKYFSVDGITLGRVVTNSAGKLVLTFLSGATQNLVDQTLSDITYTNTSDNPPSSIQIQWAFDDGNAGLQGTGAALAVVGDTTINITKSNDFPIVSFGVPDQNLKTDSLFIYAIPDNTFFDPDLDTLSYSVKMTDGTAIPPWLSFNSNTHTFSGTPSIQDLGSFELFIIAKDGSNASTSDVFRISVLPPNSVPTGSVTITGLAKQNQTLTASNTLADTDGLGVINYQWLRDDIAITNATQSIYTLTQTDVGKKISVKAGYMDAKGTAESMTSDSTALVVPIVNHAPTGSMMITGNPIQGKVLTTSGNINDADGMGTLTGQWFRDGFAVTGATDVSYTLTQADVGKSISATAYYTDGLGKLESINSNEVKIANINDAPIGNVTISGTATQNQILTANNTLTDVDGLGTISYQWLSNNKEISNASQSTYKLGQSDVGNVISVKASYTDGFGSKETVTSATTGKIENVNDAPTGAVSISGTVAQNQTLTASNTLADADGLGTINYLWLREGVAITGATKTTYTLTQTDVGKTIAVKASYIDSLGYSESMSSSATAIVADANDVPTGTVKITGTAIKGNTLIASNDLTDLDGLGTISYQWLNNGAAILDANQSTYKLTQADTGQNISVNANYVDLQNTPERVFSSKTHVASNALPTGTITIKGLATWGTTLSVTSAIKDADGLGKLSYSWQNSSRELSSSPTYTLVEDDIDTQVWLTVHYTDKKGNIEEVASKPVDVTISTKPSAVNDILIGTDKADKLSGLAGNDTLIGGLGSDKLTGGKGSDIFAFSNSDFYTKNSDGNLVFNKAIDTITDFNLKEHDLLDFGDLGELTFCPTLSAAQEDMASLFYVKATGRIYLNTNDTDGFTPSAIIIISGKPAINTDMSDWNYPA